MYVKRVILLSYSLGDTSAMAEHGSLRQYLLHRHTKEGPIIAFWMPNSQRVVSIASPELFRDTVKLFDRPGVLGYLWCYSVIHTLASHVYRTKWRTDVWMHRPIPILF